MERGLNEAKFMFILFLVAEQLYTQPCVCVCVMYVPRFVCFSTKAWIKPGSDRLYNRVQTDHHGTILEGGKGFRTRKRDSCL